MKLTKKQNFLNIICELLKTYILLFAGNSLLLYMTNYPNFILLTKYILNIADNNTLPTNNESLNSLMTYSMLWGMQAIILLYIIINIMINTLKNALKYNTDKNIGIILGLIIFLFFHTTNPYIILILIIITIYFIEKRRKLYMNNVNILLDMVEQVIQEKEAQEKENQKKKAQEKEAQKKEDQEQENEEKRSSRTQEQENEENNQ